MPTYVYEILKKDGSPTGRTFEHVQSMKDPPLAKHPQTGEPVRRAITAPNIGGGGLGGGKSSLSNKNLDRLGFTKYERKGKGYYEKTAGKGPRTIGGE
jgi:predicted nucleic acid-binding Zn ribbon protein